MMKLQQPHGPLQICSGPKCDIPNPQAFPVPKQLNANKHSTKTLKNLQRLLQRPQLLIHMIPLLSQYINLSAQGSKDPFHLHAQGVGTLGWTPASVKP